MLVHESESQNIFIAFVEAEHSYFNLPMPTIRSELGIFIHLCGGRLAYLLEDGQNSLSGPY